MMKVRPATCSSLAGRMQSFRSSCARSYSNHKAEPEYSGWGSILTSLFKTLMSPHNIHGMRLLPCENSLGHDPYETILRSHQQQTTQGQQHCTRDLQFALREFYTLAIAEIVLLQAKFLAIVILRVEKTRGKHKADKKGNEQDG